MSVPAVIAARLSGGSIYTSVAVVAWRSSIASFLWSSANGNELYPFEDYDSGLHMFERAEDIREALQYAASLATEEVHPFSISHS